MALTDSCALVLFSKWQDRKFCRRVEQLSSSSSLIGGSKKVLNTFPVFGIENFRNSGLKFSGFRIPELQEFPGFPVFQDLEPHPSFDRALHAPRPLKIHNFLFFFKCCQKTDNLSKYWIITQNAIKMEVFYQHSQENFVFEKHIFILAVVFLGVKKFRF